MDFSGKSCPVTRFLNWTILDINRRNTETQKIFNTLQKKETEEKKQKTPEASGHTFSLRTEYKSVKEIIQ